MKRVSVIIPAYNEEEAVEKVLLDVYGEFPALRTIGYSLEPILVLNNCTDRTEEIARRLKRGKLGALVIAKEPRKGYGYAHRRGIAIAKGEVLVTLDCDDTYPPGAITNMVQLLDGEYSFVTTDRLRKNPAMGSTSKIGNFLLSTVSKILTGQSLSDSQSGMWGFRREHIADLLAGVGGGMELSEQLKLRLARAADKWTCIDIDYYERMGESKLNPVGDGLRCLWHLVRT